jgi:peptidoglycan/xylan/chitin deacetylase (PgdA/CDA1 family)
MRRTVLVPVVLAAALLTFTPRAAATTSAPPSTPPQRQSAPATTTTPPAATWVHTVATSDPVVFLTIDDGFTRDAAFLAFMRRTHVPVSLFLTNAALHEDHADYFRALQAAGAVIEDHTLRHRSLTEQPTTDRRHDICAAADRDAALFGRRPTLLRAPFGAVSPGVFTDAASCDLHAVVAWVAESHDSTGLSSWWGHNQLRAGDIVLMHFTPGLTQRVQDLLALARARHLRLALLEDYV